ncbi:MAG: rhodanese-like domain-containing protein [Acidobacteria bacterium]|nr:rhodanese-like domain-containing protein [Acidobacteriota bacterium]
MVMNEIDDVDVARALSLMSDGALVLDVREDEEWQAGHVPLARHVALSGVPDVVDDLPRDRVVICVCRSGARSARAGRFLLEHGVHAVNLDGGMNAWFAADAPMVSDEGEPYVA